MLKELGPIFLEFPGNEQGFLALSGEEQEQWKQRTKDTPRTGSRFKKMTLNRYESTA